MTSCWLEADRGRSLGLVNVDEDIEQPSGSAPAVIGIPSIAPREPAAATARMLQPTWWAVG